jgi:hypothetical protein
MRLALSDLAFQLINLPDCVKKTSRPTLRFIARIATLHFIVVSIKRRPEKKQLVVFIATQSAWHGGGFLLADLGWFGHRIPQPLALGPRQPEFLMESLDILDQIYTTSDADGAGNLTHEMTP